MAHGPRGQKPEGQDHSVSGLIWTYRAHRSCWNPLPKAWGGEAQVWVEEGFCLEKKWRRDLGEGYPPLHIGPSPPQGLNSLPGTGACARVYGKVPNRQMGLGQTGGPCHVSGL